MDKIKLVIIFILIIGVLFRLFLSSGNNFIFNMDNARDMVEVREMVVLKNLRLIGQTTAIDGLFYGPAWYYILSIPFVLSGGDPYASILLEILLWAFGGYFLLLLSYKYYGVLAMLAVSMLWIASNFILLASQYAFNPNPVLFLTPVFMYTLLKYIETGALKYSVLTFLIAGLFLQFEIAVGIVIPPVILLSILIYKKNSYFRKQSFTFGIITFILTLIPQFIFELRHSFFMTKALFAYQSGSHGSVVIVPHLRAMEIWMSYYDTLLPTFMNFEMFTNIVLILCGLVIIWYIKNKKLPDKSSVIALLLVIVPLVVLIYVKVSLMRWHLNAAMTASIFLVGFTIQGLSKMHFLGKVVVFILVSVLFVFTIQNMSDYINSAKFSSPGNSILKAELSAVDFTYEYAKGKNFKVYSYLPSVIDYPYQYLYWWRGLKKYGYLPEDYAYLPNKPEYIKQKEKLNTGSKPESSGLIFLIKEPDQIGQRHLWENSFKNLELVTSKKLGPLDIEVRKENQF